MTERTAGITPYTPEYYQMVCEEAQKLVDGLDKAARPVSCSLVERVFDADQFLDFVPPGRSVGFVLRFIGDRVSVEPGVGSDERGDVNITLHWADALRLYAILDASEFSEFMQTALETGRMTVDGNFADLKISLTEWHAAVARRVKL